LEPWLIALVVIVAIAVGFVLVPIRITLSLRGRGDPSGAWAVAGGAQLGPLAVSGVAARGVPASLGAHAFGRKLWQRELAELVRAKPEQKKAERRLIDRYKKLERWFDPLDLALFLLEEKRRVRIEALEIDVIYSFEDVALTGKVLAALYVLSGVLPPPIVIRPLPTWESVDKADLAMSGSIRLRPGLVLVESAWFVVRRVKLKRRRVVAPTEAT
jgi:hypothetical protein